MIFKQNFKKGISRHIFNILSFFSLPEKSVTCLQAGMSYKSSNESVHLVITEICNDYFLLTQAFIQRPQNPVRIQ